MTVTCWWILEIYIIIRKNMIQHLYYFKKAEDEYADGFKAKFNIANTYYVLKKYDSALYYYDKSIQIRDDFPYAYFYKGHVPERNGSI
jgi:tetratricopeptide (TPR) repeat protein